MGQFLTRSGSRRWKNNSSPTAPCCWLSFMTPHYAAGSKSGWTTILHRIFRPGKTRRTPERSGVLQLYFLYFRFKLFDVILACLFNFFDPGPAIIFPYVAHFAGQFLVHDHCELYIHLYHPMEILSERHWSRANSVLTQY